MKDINYAYCVARLRANENNMLTKAQIFKLAESNSLDEALNELLNFGWIKEKLSVKEILDFQNKSLWKLLNECVPDKNELNILCILNDFFNIKTAVKCHFTSVDPYEYYIYPSSLNLVELTEKINSHKFSAIGGSFGETAENAYNTACLTENGQSAEIIIDKGSIDFLCEYSKHKNSCLINDVCAFLCDTANIKTALRINALKKNKDFADTAIGNCVKLERKTLIDLSLGDTAELMNYLLKTDYKEGIELYLKSSILYEKWCDDSIVKLVSKAKYTAFGFDPVCAYYYARQNEIKSVRIVLNGIASGLNAQEIKERVRLIYA